MSRSFNGTSDRIVVTGSSQFPVNQGNITLMALIKPVTNISNDHWIMQGYNSSNAAAFGMLETGSKFYTEGDFSGAGTPVLNNWMWVCYTKATGSVKPEWYFHNLTAATAWSHVTATGNVSDQTGPAVGVVIGGRQPGSTCFQGSIAALAAFNSILTQTQIQNASASAQALLAAAPSWGVLLNQSSTATAVTDLSGHGATQASIFGTSIDADEPPGWSYALSSSPTFKVWNGTAEVAATMKVWNGTAEVAASFSSIV